LIRRGTDGVACRAYVLGRGVYVRARFMAVLLLVATIATVPLSSDTPPASAARRRPNVLLILTDDQRDVLSRMPVVRRKFVKTGRRMKHGVVTTPLCCPSRASIFSGRYTHNHGVSDNVSGEDLRQRHTFQRYLRRAGYEMGYIGKYFNDWPIAHEPPHFDEWAIFTGKDPDYYRGGRWNIDGNVRRVNDYATTFIEDQAVDFLLDADARKDRAPWAMVVAPTAPHHPYVANSKYDHAAVGNWAGNPAVGERNRTDKPIWVQKKDRSLREGRRIRRKQMRTLMSVDDLVGTLFSTMRDLHEQRNTIAIYVSDNGYMWGEHGLAGKRRPYTASYSVPFMMRWPGHLVRGSLERRFAANIDIAPTILDAAGIDHVRRRIDGRSLLKRGWNRRRILLEQGPEPHQEFWASTLTRRYQYIEYYANDGSTVIYREYYNLKRDPWQLVNLFGDAKSGNDPPIGRLHSRLADDRDCKGTACP
jgi:arylsulfatase A-like enzyme